MRRELDVLVPPSAARYTHAMRPDAVDPAKVAVHERVPGLRLVGRAVGQAQVPGARSRPTSATRGRRSRVGAGCTSPQSLSRTYWRASISSRARATACSLTVYEAIGPKYATRPTDSCRRRGRRAVSGVRRYRGPPPASAVRAGTDDGSAAGALSGTVAMTGLGAAITLDALAGRPYELLAQLRAVEPVAWLPVLGGWLVTRRDLCIEVMRDADRFTVDEFALLHGAGRGPSMLSLDGPGAPPARRPVRDGVRQPEGGRAVHDTRRGTPRGRWSPRARTPRRRRDPPRSGRSPGGRGGRCGPSTCSTPRPAAVLGWYDEIVAAVDRVSVGGEIGPRPVTP